MTLEIDMIDETQTLDSEKKAMVESLLQRASDMEGIVGDTELSIVFVDNDRIQEINATYREKDQPTDVISFALEEEVDGEIHVEGVDLPRVLGDIIVSLPKALEQANTHGHSYERELGFLVVHGFLHLLGYDHMTAEDEKVMFQRQDDILSEYGLGR